MILKDLQAKPSTDPTQLIRLRDSIYASDLFMTAVSHLDLFSVLENDPMDLKDICLRFGLQSRPTDVMMSLFKAMGLVIEHRNLHQLTPLAREHLTEGSNWNLIPYLNTLKDRPTVNKMYEVLKSGQPASWGEKRNDLPWELAMEEEEFAWQFTEGMDSRGAWFAPGLASSFPFSGYRKILDIAGASGIYAAAIKKEHPNTKVALLERPPVDEVARKSLEKRGLQHEIEVIAGDMFKDTPQGYDVHLYSHVLHDWDIDTIMQLCSLSWKTLNPDGRIVIHDAHLNHEKSGPLSVAEYSVLLMFLTEGKCYSLGEIESILSTQGFVDIHFQSTVGNRSVISGKKPV